MLVGLALEGAMAAQGSILPGDAESASDGAALHLLRTAQCDTEAMTEDDFRVFVDWAKSTPEGALMDRHQELLKEGLALEETDEPAVQWALGKVKRRCLGAPRSEDELSAKVEEREQAINRLPAKFEVTQQTLQSQIDRHRSMFAYCKGVSFEYPEIARHERYALEAEYPLALFDEVKRASTPEQHLDLALRIEAAMPHYSATTAFILSWLYMQTDDPDRVRLGLAYAELGRRIIPLDRVPDHLMCAGSAMATALMPTTKAMEIESLAEQLYAVWADKNQEH
jgi:hypothetical protein